MNTLQDLITDYLEHLRYRRYSPETLRKARGVLNRFVSWLWDTSGVERSERLQARHLRRWYAHLSGLRTPKGHPIKACSVNRHIVTVRGWLAHLAARNHVSRKLLDELPYVKEPRMLPGNVLSHAQMRKLLSSISTDTAEGHRNRTMLELLYSTGVRASELLGLDVGHVDIKDCTMLVTGKGNKQRVVPIGETALRYLESYVTAVRPFLVRDDVEKALFLDREGRRLRYHAFWRLVHACAARASMEVNVTPHCFRRSCTTELIRNGANMYHVKELLGHESLNTLKHYARLTIIDLKRTHKKCHPRERDERW